MRRAAVAAFTLALLSTTGTVASATSLATPAAMAGPTEAAANARPPRRTSAWDELGRFYFDINWSFNAYSYYASTKTRSAQHLSPADRFTISQYGSFGYSFHPNVRVQLTLRFEETLSDLPIGERSFAGFAVIPALVFSTHGFFVGLGPLIAPRAHALKDFELGLHLLTGYAYDFGYGFSLALTLQVPVTLLERVSVSLTPGLTAACRF